MVKGLRSILTNNKRLRLIQIEFGDSNTELIGLVEGLGFKLVAFETHSSRDVGLFRGLPVVGNGWFVRRDQLSSGDRKSDLFDG